MAGSDFLNDFLDKVVDGSNTNLAKAAVSVLDEVDSLVESVLNELFIQ